MQLQLDSKQIKFLDSGRVQSNRAHLAKLSLKMGPP